MGSKIIKNTSLYTLGNILPQAAGFILLPIYTRYLTPADYGIVSSMQVLSTILAVFFTLAIDRSIFRLYFDYKIEKAKRDYLGTITISLFFISISVLLLLFIFRGIVGQIFKSIELYPCYFYAASMLRSGTQSGARGFGDISLLINYSCIESASLSVYFILKQTFYYVK